MLSKVFTIASCAVLAVTATAEVEKRAAPNAEAYSSAAAALISQYVPSDVLALITPAISSAAAAASVTGDAASLFTSVILGTTIPPWFPTQVPPQFASQFGALSTAIAELRPLPVMTVVSTNSAGSVVTATATATPGQEIPMTDSAGVVSTYTVPGGPVAVTTTDSAGSTFTTTTGGPVPSGATITTTNSAGSTFTTTQPVVKTTQTTESVPITTTNSAGSTITTSGVTTRAVTTTSSNPGALATANAAGILAVVGILAAL